MASMRSLFMHSTLQQYSTSYQEMHLLHQKELSKIIVKEVEKIKQL